MTNRYAAGKRSFGFCDRCGFRCALGTLRALTIKTKLVDLRVCQECWETDQPQLKVGMYPISDPQAIRNARPDNTYLASGTNGLQIDIVSGVGPLATGYPDGGSRVFQWGWAPVGGSRSFDDWLTPNYLAMAAQVGTVTVTTT